ncbi:restriction endonuclease subunit S [Enterobacter cloacae complex sp. ECC445]|uniref:restriction endonuclease subunit S n=1 Tax=Enterobacter cloacae complex sp. ECC445 TaxID=2913213 RepID=UPI001F17BCF8|nr:restriction endonuclease subunit S [Enterobacter cloacae complex sp. ECC445]MCG0456323.1 restriction endonuclease subunit S [Enterobacter cloacae complex sp. ECC445]
MAKYKAYPEYKDSGVEWLNSTPAHWSKAPIKYLALAASSVFLDGDWIESKDLSDDGVRYITTGNIGEGFYKEQSSGFITEKTFNKLDCTEILEGDILISRLNKPIGRACLISELNFKTVTSVDNVILRTDESYNKKYLVYLFSSDYYFQHTGNLARGTTMQRISRGHLGNIRIPVPLLSEQVIITAFLDHETTKIDNLVEKQQQLIELLKEKRQALISHAVTKGLNPDVPMKDSGVEWLGEVPGHWSVAKLKYISTLKNQILPDSTSKHFLIQYIDIGNISAENGISKPEEMFFSDAPSRARRIVKDGDIIISTVRTYLEAIAIIENPPYNLVVSTGFAVIRPKKLSKKFCLYSFKDRNFIQKIISMSVGISYPAINPSDLVTIKIPFPGYLEQDEIGDFLHRETAKIDTLIQKQLQQIDLLKERRTALISAAVTGKIDLRDWTPPASSPEESPIAEEATA